MTIAELKGWKRNANGNQVLRRGATIYTIYRLGKVWGWSVRNKQGVKFSPKWFISEGEATCALLESEEGDSL